MRIPKQTTALLACAALSLSACSRGEAGATQQSSAPAAASTVSSTPVTATPSASTDSAAVAGFAAALLAESEFTTISTVSLTHDWTLTVQGFTTDGPEMWVARPDQRPARLGGAEMAQDLLREVTAEPDAVDFANLAANLDAAITDCTTAQLDAEAVPGGQVWQRITCDGSYVPNSTRINDVEFPDAQAITSPAEWDAAVALLRPLLDADPNHIRATSTANNLPFQLTGTQRERVDGGACWDTVSLATAAEPTPREPIVYGCTTINPVFESWGSTGHPLPLDKLNGKFFAKAEADALAMRDLESSKRFHIDYYLVSETELGFNVTHDEARYSGSVAVP